MNKRFFTALALGSLLQSSVAFAQAPPQDFFENAWQEADSATDYSFSCSISAGGIKIQENKLTDGQKPVIDLIVLALKRYRNISKGALQGNDMKLSLTTEKVNTLGILDTMAAGQLTQEEVMVAVKKASKKNVAMTLMGNQVYYKGDTWKTFEHSEFVERLFKGVNADGITSDFEKDSFTYKSGAGMGSPKPTMYKGKQKAQQTTKLLTPFISEALAKDQPAASVKLYIGGKGHFKKTLATAKVVLGGLSFTVKEICQVSLEKSPQIKVPAGATPIEADAGIQEIIKLSS